MNIKKTFVDYFSQKGLNIDEFLIKGTQYIKIEVLYQIYKKSFLEFYSNKLRELFNNLISNKVLYCEFCQNTSLKNIKECIQNHNYQNIPFAFDSLFENLSEILNMEKFFIEKFKMYGLSPGQKNSSSRSYFGSINPGIDKKTQPNNFNKGFTNFNMNFPQNQSFLTLSRSNTIEDLKYDYSLTKEIVLKNIINITNLIKIRLFVLLEKFKSEKNINDPNLIISRNVKLILKELNLFILYQNIIEEFINEEIDLSLKIYEDINDKQILNDLLNVFSNYYLEWLYSNIYFDEHNNLGNYQQSRMMCTSPNMSFNFSHTNTSFTSRIMNPKDEYKSKFISEIKRKFMDMKTNKFFDLIKEYPSSSPTLQDFKICFPDLNKSKFISALLKQISNNLLIPASSTSMIIEIFIKLIKIMKALEGIAPTPHLLDCFTLPIKEYLRARKDTMQCIVTIILNEDDQNMVEDMNKAYVRATKKYEYDLFDSDYEDSNQIERNDNQNQSNLNAVKEKDIDIISTLVNIFGSPETFMEQYKRMLSERMINNNKFSLENEIKNLELLKHKFGEATLQHCDIVIKDIKDSLKLNMTEIKDPLINCLVINKNYWPFNGNEDFEINNIEAPPKVNFNPDANVDMDESISDLNRTNKISSNSLSANKSSNKKDRNENTIQNTTYDQFLSDVKSHIDEYKKNYKKIKCSRNLNLFTNVGYVELNLSFTNGTFKFIVSILSAFVIKFFSKENEAYFKIYTIPYMAQKLKAEEEDIKKKINFWVTKGASKEVLDERGNVEYYLPEETFKQSESNKIIIEDEIYNFDYPTETFNTRLIENSIISIIKSTGPKNFEQLYKNLVNSYQLEVSEIKLKDLLGSMNLEQKVFKEGELYKLLTTN
ncbi:MAG: hypothetical protein MJ252_08505 [archaeon]|nr:hypothetical protein [archaeon]